MKLWLDDIRDPEHYGKADWVWVKTASEAIKLLRTGEVEEASFDHDLTDEQTFGSVYGQAPEWGQKSGYDVINWLEYHDEFWPKNGVQVHSMNPVGRARMQQVIDKHYKASEITDE